MAARRVPVAALGGCRRVEANIGTRAQTNTEELENLKKGCALRHPHSPSSESLPRFTGEGRVGLLGIF